MIVLGLFLATVSIPADIKSKTIYTIVTKPVRAGELVLGRIFGFIAVVTVLLVAMGVISYLFVVRGMQHEHRRIAGQRGGHGTAGRRGGIAGLGRVDDAELPPPAHLDGQCGRRGSHGQGHGARAHW